MGAGIERDVGTNGWVAPQRGGTEDHVGKPPGCAVKCLGGDGNVTTLYVGGSGDVTRLSLGGVGTGETGAGRVMAFPPVQVGIFVNVSDLTGHLSVSFGFPEAWGGMAGKGDIKTPVYWAWPYGSQFQTGFIGVSGGSLLGFPSCIAEEVRTGGRAGSIAGRISISSRSGGRLVPTLQNPVDVNRPGASALVSESGLVGGLAGAKWFVKSEGCADGGALCTPQVFGSDHDRGSGRIGDVCVGHDIFKG